MSKQDKKSSQLHSLLFLKAMIIGLCGGLIWSVLFLFMHTFNMTEVDPFFFFKMLFVDSAWLSKWYAYFILIITYAILSVFVAIVYYLLFKRKQSWFIGAGYGVLLWGIVYWILPLTISNFNSFLHFEIESHIAMLSLLLLYGVFVGYSISYDYVSLQKELEQ